MKKCLISSRSILSSYGEEFVGISARMLSELGKIGYECAQVHPPRLDARDIQLGDFDLLILSGGIDVGKDARRDLFEYELLSSAQRSGIASIGICRGMQIMVTFCGGTLVEVEGHVSKTHPISGQLSGTVNSFHRWAISSCPPEFEVLSRSEDDVIEAILNRNRSWLGVMFHPERDDSSITLSDLLEIVEIRS